MKLKSVGALFVDLVKGCHRGGRTLSDNLMARLDMSPKSQRIGGGLFDLGLGAVVTYSAATGAVSTALGIVAAATAVASAPVTALGAIGIGAVWLTLSTLSVAFGTGLLRAAHQKSGLPSLRGAVDALKDKFRKKKSGRKTHRSVAFDRPSILPSGAAQKFRAAVNANKTPAPKPAAPKRVFAPKI